MRVSGGHASTACTEKARAAFTRSYAKALAKEVAKGGECPLHDTQETVADAWLNDIDGASTLLSRSRKPSLGQTVREGMDGTKESNALYAELLAASGKTCKSALAAYAKDAVKPDQASLAARLAQAVTRFLAKADGALARAETRGVQYTGNASALIADRIAQLAEARRTDTLGKSGGDGPGPQPTGHGEPNGAAISGEIGADGGRLQSEDGSFALEIPQGAVSQATTFSIQPITNHIGAGTAFRFEPDGIEFAKPVTLQLRYDPEAADPNNLAIAFQDAQGYWRSAPDSPVVDTATGTVAISLPHFSDWAFYERWFLVASNSELYTGDFTDFELMEWENSDCRNCLLLPRKSAAAVKEWRVNGIRNGSSAVGTIGGFETTATYEAPTSVPRKNPVAVSGVVDTGRTGKGQLLVVSNLLIKPRGWRGSVFLKFEGQRIISDDFGQEIATKAEFFAEYEVKSMLSDSYSDDGSQGIVMLELSTPNVRYTASEEGSSVCGGSGPTRYWRSLENFTAKPSGVYDGYSHVLLLEVLPDKTARLPYLFGTQLVMNKLRRYTDCNGQLSEESDTYEDGIDVAGAGEGPFIGEVYVEDGKPSFVGFLTKELEVRLPGPWATLLGTVTISWDIRAPD